MTTTRPTEEDIATSTDAVAQAASNATTRAPASSNRNESTIWTERMLSQARGGEGDVARFMKGL